MQQYSCADLNKLYVRNVPTFGECHAVTDLDLKTVHCQITQVCFDFM